MNEIDGQLRLPGLGTVDATAEDLRRVLSELAVQNEELRRARAEAEADRACHLEWYDRTSTGFITVSESGCILEVNRAAALLFGMDGPELRGVSASRLFAADGEGSLQKLWEKAGGATSPFACELKMRRADGTQFWSRVEATAAWKVLDSPALLLELRPVEFPARFRDELIEKDERLALVTSQNRIGIWDWNLVTGEIAWDDSMFAIHNVRREDFNGTDAAWKLALHPEDLERFAFELGEALKGGKPLDTEFRIVWPAGEVRYGKAVAKVFTDDRGRAVRMLGTSSDITERKNAQAALASSEASLWTANESLRRSNEELEHRVSVRTAQLRTLAIELTRAEERERLRIADTLHEGLLQQLAAASIHLSNFKRQIEKGARPQGIEDMRACLEEGIRIGRTLTHEIFPPELQTLGLGDALHWLANWYREKYGLIVHVEAGAEIEIDEMEFRIALFRAAGELLFNAHKHSGVNEAALLLRRAPGGSVRLVVSDSGVGFDPKSARAQEGRRGGFGLFSLRERIEALGGLFHIRSAPGRGSRVTVLFAMRDSGDGSASLPTGARARRKSPVARLHPPESSRERAEFSLSETARNSQAASESEVDMLVHRLHVHQIELEMRNEELMRARIELDVSRARYRDLYELAPVGYLTTDSGGAIMDVNLAGASMLGSLKDRLLGVVFGSFIHPEDHARFRALQNRVRTSGVGETCELRMLKSGGACFWALLSAVAAEDDSNQLILRLTLSDITARKEADDALRETGRRLRLHYAQTPIGIIEWDPNLRVTLWNPAAEAIFGYSATEAMGRDAAFIVPETARAEMDGVWLELLNSKSTNRCFNENRRSDGRIISCEWYNTQLVGDDGTVKGVASFVVDVTERRKAEIERETLERKMQETQKLESLGVLAGGIAHDFNNLLTGILGNANLAAVELPANSAVRSHLELIVTESRRAADLCNELLAYSGRGRFAVESLDLCRLVEETSRMLKVSVGSKAVLQFHLAKELPAVDADAAQIRQVIINLVINASEAIGGNRGDIIISTGWLRADRVYLDAVPASSALPEGDYVFLDVSDTGCGMSAETLSRIFDPFFTTKYTGRGLGLASALGIVRSHKGALLVESKPGRGSTFRMLLPARNPDGRSPIATVSNDEAWQGCGTILVSDDEESVRRIVSRMLSLLGFEVVLTCDGREAVEAFTVDPARFALVLLDLSMPNLGGEEAYAIIRKIRSDVPVVLMSGYDMNRAMLRFPSRGLSTFLPKPFSLQELRTALRAAVS